MTRVLVTGATGLIGRQVVHQLEQAGYDVHAVARPRNAPGEASAATTWHEVNLANSENVKALLRHVQPTLLFHLAWPLVTGSTHSDQHRDFVAVSQSLIETFYESGGTRVVVAGTCFEYDWSKGLCTEDQTPANPGSTYGASKNALRLFLETRAMNQTQSWAWARIFFVYGPHQDPTRFVPAVIRGLLRRQPVPCTLGTQVRDYLHTQDVASALIQLCASGYRGVCNVGSGQPTTLRDIASEIARTLGGEHLLLFGARPTPEGEPPVILANVNRLHAEIRWQPQFTLAEGLAHTIEYWRNSRTLPALA